MKLPRVFWILFAGTFVNRVGSFVVPLFTIFLTQARHFSPTFAGLVLSLYGLGSICSAMLGGYLADRIGRRRTLLIGLSWGAVAMLLVPLASAPSWMAFASFHLGFAGDVYRPSIHAGVADVCPPEQRPRAYGLLFWAMNLGTAIATSSGGLLAQHHFGLLFVIDAATTLAFMFVVAIWVPETHPTVNSASPAQGRWSDAFGDARLMRLALTVLLVGLVFLQAQTALPVAMLRRGMKSDVYGLLLGINGLLIVALQPLLAPLVTRTRRTRVLAVAALLTGVGFAWNAFPLGIFGAVTGTVLWTLGEIASASALPSVIADLAPAHLRGRYQGLVQMAMGLCALLGPIGGMALLAHTSPETLWCTCLAFGVVAASLCLQTAPAKNDAAAD